MSKIVICCFCFLLISCRSSQDMQLIYVQSPPHPDGSVDVRMATYVGQDTIDFGSSRVLSQPISFLSTRGDSLRLDVWHSAPTTSIDRSRLILLMPGFSGGVFSLYPLAIEATRRGSVVGIVHPRGSGLNSGSGTDFRSQETQDLILAINAYETQHGSPVSVAALGISLGGVSALNLLTRDSRVKRAVLESIMSDPIELAKKALQPSEYDQLQTYLAANNIDTTKIKPYHLLGSETITKPMLFVWGADDNVVPAEERSYLKSLIQQRGSNAQYQEVQGIGHVMRFGFPLSATRARQLNSDIVTFLQGF